MYGMINTALADLVKNQFGEDQWKKILEKTGLADALFDHLTPYPDHLTYQLVGAACEELQVPAEAMLNLFGKHWVRYAESNGYKEILSLFGNNLRNSLENLNHLHARMSLLMPKLSPPRFEVPNSEFNQDPRQMELWYFSNRAGLLPMLQGIIEGLAEKFGEKITIKIEPKAGPQDPDIIKIFFQD